MAHEDDEPPAVEEGAAPGEQSVGKSPRGWRRKRRIAAAALGAVLVLGLGTIWLGRERIADNVIASQLESLGLPATYTIESVGPDRQVLRDIVIGDPKRPDLTIERVEARIVLRWGIPSLGRITLVKPRLYGRYRDSKLSFGSLDPVLFTDSKAPFRLPDLDLAVVDGRGVLESDAGSVGVKIEGKGELRGGFSGHLAAIAPQVLVGDCRAERASLYGAITIKNDKPRFAGPLRLASLSCATSGLRLADAGIELDATFDQPLDGLEAKAGLRTGALALGDNRLTSASGTSTLTFRKRALTARYDIAGKGIETAQAAAGTLRLEGAVRSDNGLARVEVEGTLAGEGIRSGKALDARLADVQRSAEGTLAGPLLSQFRGALARAGADSRLTASYVVRHTKDALHLVVPQAALRSANGGETLLALSRFQLTTQDGALPHLGGNFATGGAGLPQIAGRLDRQPGGELVMRVTMADYAAGTARVALPRLTVVQGNNGSLGFSGEVRVSGALPGGFAQNLQVPLDGNWSSRTGLAAWRGCTTVRFDRLELASLSLERRGLMLCPPKGGAILRSGAGGTRIAAGTPSLDLSGRLGETPVRITSGAVGFAVPGALNARALDVALGPAATASRFRIANLDARIGRDVAGRFIGTDVRLSAVPLDLLDATGAWRFADGRLTLSGATFRLEDREVDDRFRPLIARDATLTLANNAITADALLREPISDRAIVRAAIRHDLGTAHGSADLAVDGIVFDKGLQPDTLTRLALGVVANGEGTVRGAGRIDWTPEKVTSTGRFSTDSFDFAAAFGPVKGASGTIVFTDLLGMVTAPGQQLRIASINPGIEVNDGVVTYELRPDSVLAVDGGRWPFMDGTLRLRPVLMRMGVAEERRYTLEIEGINAARFVERLELANLAATGTFDGVLPLIFDENGGRIEGGQLRSRPPGGNVSYVGALTYKDLSAMANFAFDALKSLDYRDMTIGMEGSLAGEIVTRVQLEGIRQGDTAKRNFLTKKIARLPIRFNINLRAPFLQIASSFRSMYDPAYVRDPRELGLIDAQGKPLAPTPAPAPIPFAPAIVPRDVQPSESGKVP